MQPVPSLIVPSLGVTKSSSHMFQSSVKAGGEHHACDMMPCNSLVLNSCFAPDASGVSVQT